jgi:hypothetical protein
MYGANFEQKNEGKTNYYEQDKTFISDVHVVVILGK